MKCQSFPFFAAVFAVIFAWGLSSLHAADEAPLDTATIQAITGLKGVSNQKEGTFKVSKPREDVSVTVEQSQSRMAPFMGLTSWAAFMPSGKDSAMVMGDIVLFEDEVNPVMSAALNAGLQVTALHNHFFFDKPKVYFMHIGGEGSVAKLAQSIRANMLLRVLPYTVPVSARSRSLPANPRRVGNRLPGEPEALAKTSERKEPSFCLS